MEDFAKFDLSIKTTQVQQSTQPDRVNLSQKSTSSMRTPKTGYMKRNMAILLGVLGVIVLFIIVGIVIPGLALYKDVKALNAQAKVFYGTIKSENVDTASTELANTQAALAKTQSQLHVMGYLAFIPVANFYYSDASHGLAAASYGLDAAKIMIDSVKPYADVLGLKGSGSYVGGPASQRLQTMVVTMDKITPHIDDIAAKLALAKGELDQVNPNHYPAFLVGPKISSQIEQGKTLADEVISFVTQAKPLVKALPSLLGSDQDRKYFIIFQNDKEQRPTGGFMTAYAILRLEKGLIHLEASDDMYSLDATIPNKPAAPRPIALYLPTVTQWNLRDTNLSPDFISSMDEFNTLYKKSSSYRQIDGIIAIDTYPVVTAINVLGGQIDVDGSTFTTKIDPQCNCADVIYRLEQYADQPVGYVRTGNRKSLIGDLMIAIMNKAFSSPSRQVWGPLIQGFITDASQKHILFDLNDPAAQQGVEALNVSGRIKDFDGDYFHFNESNMGGVKSQLYITEAVKQDYQIASDGTITKTITVNYKNPYPPSDCNLEHGQLCLNSTNRDWFRFYVPKGSQLIDSQGSEVKMTTYDDLGKTVFDGFLTVRPLGSATLTIKYQLPFKLQGGSPLPVLIQKQPGTNDNQYTITLNGHQVQQFPLLQDTTLQLKP